MKYPTHSYAQALAEVIRDPKAKAHEAEIVKNFLALLHKNGDESHARKIVEEAARLARRYGGGRKVTVESARRLTPAQKKLVHGFLKKDDTVEERIDPDLIAGIRIILNDEMQFDGSLRGKVDKIFNNI